jgi:hypothetical protein
MHSSIHQTHPRTYADRRRRGPRKEKFVPATLLAPPPAQAAPVPVILLNHSAAAVGLKSSRALPVGYIYHLRVPGDPFLRDARVTIVSCRTDNAGGWHVGAEFG